MITESPDHCPLRRWGRFVNRHGAPVLVLALAVLAVSALFLLRGEKLSLNLSVAGQARDAEAAIHDQLPEQGRSSFRVVFEGSDLAADSDEFRAEMRRALAPVSEDDRVVRVATPDDGTAAPTEAGVSRRGDAAFATVFLRDGFDRATGYYPELRERIRSDRLTVRATGDLAVNHDLSAELDADLAAAESISLPLSLALLLIVFGTVVAALLPLGVGILAVVSGTGAVMALAAFTDVSDFAPSLVSLLGLGLAIDYSLFLTSRFRDELRAHGDVEQALATALSTVGRAVLFSGLTVIAGLSGLLFFRGTFLPSLGVAAMFVVLFAMLYAFTFLAALLALLGPRIDRFRVMRGSHRTRFWPAVSHTVMRRPWLFVPALALLAVAVVPFFHARLETSELNVLPAGTEAARANQTLVADFPGQDAAHLTVVARFPGADPGTPENVAAVSELRQAIEADPAVAAVTNALDEPGGAGVGRDLVLLDVTATHTPASDGARDLVGRIRDLPLTGGQVLVTGPDAVSRDLADTIASDAPWALGFVVLAVYLVLLLTLRSVLLPLKAVVMTLLSITASFGALVWVFQDGHLASLLDVTPADIDPAVPVLLFCLVFGLSMDYEVLLLSRIQEEYVADRDNRRAVAAGLQHSGRQITGAAVIMVAVFASFAVGDVVLVRALGLGLALAVAVDATIIRCIAVPALMRLLGRANWWAPGRLGHPALRQAPTEQGHDVVRVG